MPEITFNDNNKFKYNNKNNLNKSKSEFVNYLINKKIIKNEVTAKILIIFVLALLLFLNLFIINKFFINPEPVDYSNLLESNN